MDRSLKWRQLLPLVLAIAVVQTIYWQLIDKPLFNAVRTAAPEFAEITHAEVARLSEPSVEAVRRARFRPVELPWTWCCDPAIHAVRMEFALDKVPTTGLGLISTLQVDNYRLYVNGSLLVGEGRMGPEGGSFHGQKMFLTRIPSGLVRPGSNTLTYITLRNGFPYADISAPLVGEFEAMNRFSANRLWNTNEFYRYGAGLLGLLGLLAAIMVVRAQDWRLAAWLSVLCAAFVANYAYAIILDPPFGGWGRMVAFFVVNMAVPIALLCFIDAWTGRPVRHLQALACGLYALGICWVAWSILRTPMPDGFDHAAQMWTWFLMFNGAASALRIGWHFAREVESRVLESALLTVCVTAVLFDGAGMWFPQFGEANLNNAAPFLMLAMLAAFIGRNFKLFQSQTALNDLLRATVERREAELAEAHEREQVLVAHQAHEAERRRIMQDIHDGVGSQLMSMMLSARLGEAEPSKIAEGLQSVIDEMRLMIDSMDSVGESLDAALATFRARVQPRIISAGFACDWTQPEPLNRTDFGPRDVLQVFRILQEAVTNALKHSGGNAIAIIVTNQPEEAEILIVIADNGTGGAAPDKAGRGLKNMQTRASAIGARCEVTSQAESGTKVAVRLPCHGMVASEPV